MKRTQEEPKDGELEMGGYWDTAIEENGIPDNDLHSVIEVGYSSSRSRKFFPCKSENEALTQILYSVKHVQKRC